MLRVNLVLGAVPVGLATGLLAWIAAGGGSALPDRLRPAEARLAALASRPTGGSATVSFVPVASLISNPLLLMTVGAGAVSEPAVRLEGVSVSRRRAAALVSIGDNAAEWMVVGETRGGVTIREVSASRIVVETLLGDRDVALGERIGGSSVPPTGATPASQGPSPASQGAETIPPGFRSPPPPASAPGLAR